MFVFAFLCDKVMREGMWDIDLVQPYLLLVYWLIRKDTRQKVRGHQIWKVSGVADPLPKKLRVEGSRQSCAL